VKERESLSLCLLKGSCEIFGIELAVNKKYSFINENIAVFTWDGCTIRTEGTCQAIYTSNETPMATIVNINAQLEARREVAMANGDSGPRVLIAGPHDSGKSTTARILSAYATRLDRNPVLVDIDVGHGMLSVPGCIGAVPLEKSSLAVEGDFQNSTPLVYFFGDTTPKDNIPLFKHMVSNLSEKVASRQEYDAASKASGLIVTSFGWIDGDGFDLLLHTITTFSIDIVIVIGQDRLYSSLQSASAGLSASKGENKDLVVVKLARSGGVVQRSDSDRRHLRKAKIHEYFYGYRSPQQMDIALSVSGEGGSRAFSPARMELALHKYTLLRAGGVQLSSSMMPIGRSADPSRVNEAIKLIPTQPSQEMENSLLAVLHPPTKQTQAENTTEADSIQTLLNTNVAGFLFVVKVDIDQNTLTVLSPCPGALPSNNLVVGSIKWVE